MLLYGTIIQTPRYVHDYCPINQMQMDIVKGKSNQFYQGWHTTNASLPNFLINSSNQFCQGWYMASGLAKRSAANKSIAAGFWDNWTQSNLFLLTQCNKTYSAA